MEYVLLIKGKSLISCRVIYGAKFVKIWGHPSITKMDRGLWNHLTAEAIQRNELELIGVV